jgi:hypothetical protein
MAQRIEFLRASDTDALATEFNDLIERLHAFDARFIVTPVGFVASAPGGYVLAVLIEAPHKTTFIGLGLDSIDAAAE